jgi:hypothetical protein
MFFFSTLLLFFFFFCHVCSGFKQKKKIRTSPRGLGGKILFNYNLNIAKAIPVEDLKKSLNDYKVKNNIEVFKNNNNLCHYLAGLLEGDGHISLPSGRCYNVKSSIKSYPLQLFFFTIYIDICKKKKITEGPDLKVSPLIFLTTRLFPATFF